MTSADVARAAGVSRATVSYVLNDVPGRTISAATRDRVLRVAASLGHVPSASARALRSGRSRIVLALVPSFEVGHLFDRTLAAVNERLAALGYALLVHQHSEEQRSLAELWGVVNPTLVLATNGLDASGRGAIRDARVAVVDVAELGSFDGIGRLQAERLVSRGHRVLAFAMPTDPRLEAFARERLQGVIDVCSERGLPAPRVLCIERGATDPLAQWRALVPRPSAICAYNDELALELWAVLARSGLTPGEDVALIGVDDIPLAAIGLTTVAFDAVRFGARIAGLIEHRLGHTARPPALDEDFTRLVERDSA
ncbi:MAG: LacI family DNA-binding transcriptional regulator [Microbacteriaceae bacterium]